MDVLLTRLSPGGFRPLKGLWTMSGHHFNEEHWTNPPSLPPTSGCLVLAPKQFCSFKKAWEIAINQQESLAVLLGHTSGTQVTGIRNSQHQNSSWHNGWWHTSRDPTLNGLNMQQGSDYGKDPDGSNSCWHEAEPRQEPPSGILPPFSAFNSNIYLSDVGIQHREFSTSEFWICIRFKQPQKLQLRMCEMDKPSLPLSHTLEWQLSCVRCQRAATTHGHGTRGQLNKTPQGSGGGQCQCGLEAEQTDIFTLRSQEKAIQLYLI